VTERLYYRDPSLTEFDATIQAVTEADGRFRTVLDRSAFYPTSGGQLFDTGLINGIAVVDVIDEGASVLHISELPVGKVGEKVTGVVDRPRRTMHRQQHTAQHILSQVFIREFHMETVSVHLGDDYGAIELDNTIIEPDQFDKAERIANDIIYTNWPVSIMFVSGAELDAIPLRKIPSREGELRVIKIGEFDYSACGGTHCNSTAEVSVIKIIGWEKLRGHALVKFLAGSQALEDYRSRFAVTDTLAKALTCHPNDLPGKVDKLSAENKDQRKQMALLYKELLPLRAEALIQNAQQIGTLHYVYKAIDGMDASTAGQLASMVADKVDGLVLFVADGKLLISVGAGSGLHAGELAKKLSGVLGLKGGGSNKAAQLGGADLSKLEEYKAALLSQIGHA
jgi:alanyl-tRNA synthetase